MSTQLDRIEQMLEALCRHLGVESPQTSHKDEVHTHGTEEGHRYAGAVSRFEHGWGFIESSELGRTVFVHYSDVEGTGLRLLEPGESVSFEVAAGKDGRPKAVRVQRAKVIAGQRSGETPGSLPNSEPDDEMPQPDSSGTPVSQSLNGRPLAGRVSFRVPPSRRPPTSW